MGIHVRPLSRQDYVFTNVVYGNAEKPQAWWVFAVGTVAPESYYNVASGLPGKLLAFPVTAPVVCTAYRVESGFALRLNWATENTPEFFTRTFDKIEH